LSSARLVDDWPRGDPPAIDWLDGTEPLAYHRSLPEYRPTPLHSMPHLAARAGVAAIWIKDESQRFGLRAFKGLGASYAVERLLREDGGRPVLVTATDGNHGRAVAWAAGRKRVRAIVCLPSDTSAARESAVAALGAEIRRVPGTYDDAVRAAAKEAARPGRALLQDSAWEGYDREPRWIMQGYLTMMEEALEQLGAEVPTHVLLQCGVGSFAAAMTGALVNRFGEQRPRIAIVEPIDAACGLAAAAAGTDSPPAIDGDLHTFMACLSCGRLSTLAWPILRAWADAFVACPDDVAMTGMRALAHPGAGDPAIESGESGAATVGALLGPLTPDSELGARLALDAGSRVLLFSTEGATDPEIYARITASEVSHD
jgi:diaminopropionate ammonia-lyase